MSNILIDEGSPFCYYPREKDSLKMKIANFRDYVKVLREVYSRENMDELGNYYRALMASGSALKKQKALLQKEVYHLNAAIKRQAEKIRQAEDKKAAGLAMAELRRQKQEQVKCLKELQNSDHFNVLSEEAKVCVCSGFLLQKYMARELLENNPLHFPTDAKGNLVVNTDELRRSDILQEAGHIRDFVAAYLVHYPEKVKTPGHFKTMLNGVRDWRGLLEYANDFFEKLNDNDFLEEGPVKASRQGTEVIQTWPDRKLQLVRLHTQKALDYESDKMNHCVGKGGYDKDVLSGKTFIYSLRDNCADGEWLPHATIEYRDGKIKQIKGYKDKEIDAAYRETAREAVMFILGNDMAGLVMSDKLADARNLGYIADVSGKLYDVSSLHEEIELSSFSLDDKLLPPEKFPLLTVKSLSVSRPFKNEDFEILRKFKKIRFLENGYDYDGDALFLRQQIFSVLGILNYRKAEDRVGVKLLQTMGIISDIHGKLHDVYMLKEDIELASLQLDSKLFPEDKLPFLTVKTMSAARRLTDADFEKLMKFKKIGFLKASEGYEGDYRMLRRQVFALTGGQSAEDVKTRVDAGLMSAMGFAIKIEDPSRYDKRGRICFDLSESGQNRPEEKWVDVTDLDETAHIGQVSCGGDVWRDADMSHLICRDVNMKGELQPEDAVQLSRLSGAYDVHFDHVSFKQIQTLDLSGLQMFERQLEKTDVMTASSFFLEGYTVSHFLAGSSVIFHGCRDLSPEAIRLPRGIKHVMFDTADCGTKIKLPDFSRYENLESLQVNHFDLSENETVRLPKGLKYLAFYDCSFGSGKNMDLSRFENLSVLRVKGCDLQGVERFAFPSGLEAFAIGGALFARGAALDLSGCHQMKIFDVDASFENKEIALSRITFPEEIEEIKLCGLKFSEIESFDLRAYPNLRCADVERSAFPKLRKLLLPAGCELKKDNWEIPAETEVVRGEGAKEFPPQEVNLSEHFLRELKFKGVKIIDAGR